MDPYLEQFWGDIHARLVLYAADGIQPKLPGDLRCRVQERVVVENPLEDRSIYPDVRVIERGYGSSATAVLESAVAVAEPLVIGMESAEERTETFIEIIDIGSGKRVVTVIEFLSPSNKSAGDAQTKYRAKQQELRAGRVSLVEIDFLRGGGHGLAIPSSLVPRIARPHYKACVCRGWKPQQFEFYALPIRQRLPGLRIPLRETDADVVLDLQAAIDQCYRNGGYDNDIDYRDEPVPPLGEEDAAWSNDLLRDKGLR
jgi:hypothetical protein